MTTETMAICAICERLLSADDLSQCRGCGEHHCHDGCPAFACACVSDDQEMQELRKRLREAAIERAQLMNQECLSDEERSRLLLVHELTESLRNEVNRLDEIAHGEDYAD